MSWEHDLSHPKFHVIHSYYHKFIFDTNPMTCSTLCSYVFNVHNMYSNVTTTYKLFKIHISWFLFIIWTRMHWEFVSYSYNSWHQPLWCTLLLHVSPKIENKQTFCNYWILIIWTFIWMCNLSICAAIGYRKQKFQSAQITDI